MTEIVVARQLEAMQPAADVDRMAAFEQVTDAGVLAIGRAEDLLGFQRAVGLPAVLDVEDGEDDALRVAQRDLPRIADRVGEFLVDIEGDRHRPQAAVAEAHLVAHRLVVAADHEAAQRGKSAGQQHFEVAQLARSQIPRGQAAGGALE